MLSFVVLALAIVSRFLPHLFHATAWNFTAIGGGLLFFGSRMRSTTKGQTALRLIAAVAALAVTDYCLTVFVYGYPFRASWYAVTWLWYAAICLLGMGLLSKPSVLRLGAGAIGSATSFFLLSNFMVWLGGTMYPRTVAGLGACYAAGVPFYRNDLVSTGLVAGALFGLPVLAAKIAESLHAAQNQPLA